MQLADLSPHSSLELLNDEWMYSYSRLSEDPRCAALVAAWQTAEVQWSAANAQQRRLDLALVQAQQRVDLADDELNALVDSVHVATQKRQPPVLALLFKVSPSMLKRHVLGRQLRAMATWPQLLTESAVPAWAALAPVVQAALDKGAATSLGKQNAAAAIASFRTIGERRALVPDFNALRQTTLNDLAQLSKAHPEYNLPSAWPSRFFRRHANETPSVESLMAAIEAAEAQVLALKQRLQALNGAQAIEDEAQKSQADAERAEAIAALKKSQAEGAARLAALENG